MTAPGRTTDAGCIVYEAKGRDLIAKLGVLEVGMVSPLYSDGEAFGAQWRCYLPCHGVAPRPARDLDEARERLNAAIMGWIDAAALAPAAPPVSPIRAFRRGGP